MALRTELVRRLTLRAEGGGGDEDGSLAEQPERRTRQEMMQRLQFGVGGVLTMFLLVGLANVINNRTNLDEALAIAETTPVAEPATDPMKDDPLVSAGVVPDLPAEPEPVPQQGGSATPAPPPAE